MEDLFIQWKNGVLTATNVNTRLSDLGLPYFTNNIEDGFFVDPVSFEKIVSPDKKMASILIGNTIFLPNTLKDLVNSTIDQIHLDMPNSTDIDEFAYHLETELRHPITRNAFTREELDEIFEKIFEGTQHEYLHDFARGIRKSRHSGGNMGGKSIRRKKTRRKKTRLKKTRRKKTTHRKKKRRVTKRR